MLGDLGDAKEDRHRLLVLAQASLTRAQASLGLHAPEALDRFAMGLDVALEALGQLAQPRQPLRFDRLHACRWHELVTRDEGPIRVGQGLTEGTDASDVALVHSEERPHESVSRRA